MRFSLPVMVRPIRHVAVYQGRQLVLLAEDKPGVLSSTAALASSGAPQHPFIHAQATWAAAEHEIGGLLRSSDSFDAYLAALVAHGCDILSVDDKAPTQKLSHNYRVYRGDQVIGVACPLMGQFMTLQQQPALGELLCAFASMTAYELAEADMLMTAFTQATDFEALLGILRANGLRLEDL